MLVPLDKLYKEVSEKMKKTVDNFHQEVSNIRTGIASSGMLDSVKVECYGSLMPINQVASVSIPEPRTLVVQPWDVTVLPNIEKAILKSELGFMPNNDGKIIRINIPSLTQERRAELVKFVKKIAEENRVAVRNTRRDANEAVKKMQKDKQITEDDEKKAIEHIQKLTTDFTNKINEILEHKETELTKV